MKFVNDTGCLVPPYYQSVDRSIQFQTNVGRESLVLDGFNCVRRYTCVCPTLVASVRVVNLLYKIIGVYICVTQTQ